MSQSDDEEHSSGAGGGHSYSSSSSTTSSRRNSSPSSQSASRSRQYVPLIPSQLRNSHRPPPTPVAHPDMAPDLEAGDRSHDYFAGRARRRSSRSSRQRVSVYDDSYDRLSYHEQDEDEDSQEGEEYTEDDDQSLVEAPANYQKAAVSPNGFGGRRPGDPDDSDVEPIRGLLGGSLTSTIFGPKASQSTTQNLARRHGVRSTRLMYLYYYLPSLKWMHQLSWSYVAGDFIAALTMASFYIPMSLSYASNLGHVPPVNGLYSFVFNPLIYALLGTCPQMVVGPEAAGSLLTGNVVRDSISRGKVGDADGHLQAQVAGVVTAVAGSILLLAGITRLGFLDNVLSRPFLRGFISAIGVVILIDQLIPETGLNSHLRKHKAIEHGSPIMKAIFVVEHIKKAHGLTCAVSFGSFAITMICREFKRRMQPKYPRVAYIPDRFAIVAIATILAWKLDWESKGLSILGNVTSDDGKIFTPEFPFDFSHMKHLESALSTSFVIALLGFFESSVAAKSLGVGPADGIKDMTLSANRELIALGTANVLGGTFMALPAFGGYGRSKVNASTGGRTPMSSIFLSLITLLCILFLMPAFYYIPKGVLASMVSVVAWSLVEEAPHDLLFFWRLRAWTELFLAALVFFATIFYSLPLGIACGIGFSLLRVIKHATRPRIQILGRVHGTDDQFENAEADPDRMEFIEGCLIVKIPEPLHFANTGDLKERLRRLEDYGAASAHPALPRVRRQENNKNIIFDIHGVTALDGAGAQILSEILQGYVDKGVRVFFCRVPNPRSHVWRLLDRSGIIDLCGGPRHFVSSVQEALRMSELESLTEWFRDHPQ